MAVTDSFSNLRNVTFTFLNNVSFTTDYSLSDDMLNDLNDKMVISMLPTLIYNGLLMLTGLVGNTLVFVIYYKRFKPNPTRTYILTMSISDLLANSISLPGDILEIRYFYTFDMPELCKFIRFIKYCLTIFSSFILVAVALDRYHKICQPFKKQCITYPTVAAIAGSTVASLVSAIPYIILIGRQTVQTRIANVTGVRCTVDDAYVNTIYIATYNALTFVAFVTSVIILVVCYARIAHKLWVHKKQTAKTIGTAPVSSSINCHVHERVNDTEEESAGKINQSEVNKECFELSSGSASCEKEEMRKTSKLESDLKDSGIEDSIQYVQVTTSNEENAISNSVPHTSCSSLPTTPSEKLSKSQKNKEKSFHAKQGSVKKITSSTTFMMFVLTAVFVINYLPYLIISLTSLGQHMSPDTMSYVAFNFYHIALRSYFINCAVNPIIYCFCSTIFRHECRLLMRWNGNEIKTQLKNNNLN